MPGIESEGTFWFKSNACDSRIQKARPFRWQDLVQSYADFEKTCDWEEARAERLYRELRKLADHNKAGPMWK